MPIVSILTATYNRPTLLPEAIDSMLAQTYDNWEMLVLDDGSEPSVEPIVNVYSDPRVRYVRLEHVGLPAARNQGLELAVGNYIGFLDDDDLYHPHKLASEIAFFHSHPEIELVGSGYRLVNNDGTTLHNYKPWQRIPVISGSDILYGVPLIPCSVLIARRSIEKLGHWFDPAFDRGVGDDTDFFTRLFLAGARFEWLKEITCDYRRLHERSGVGLLDSWHAQSRVLDKAFQSPGLSPEVIAQRNSVYLNFQLKYAWAAYAVGAIQAGQRFLLQALLWEPRLADDKADLLWESLTTFSGNRLFVEDSQSFIDSVLARLPAPLKSLAVQNQTM